MSKYCLCTCTLNKRWTKDELEETIELIVLPCNSTLIHTKQKYPHAFVGKQLMWHDQGEWVDVADVVFEILAQKEIKNILFYIAFSTDNLLVTLQPDI